METIVKSPTQTVIIGPNQPFVISGERINPTGRKRLAAEMQAGDFSRVVAMPWHKWPRAHTFWTSTLACPAPSSKRSSRN